MDDEARDHLLRAATIAGLTPQIASWPTERDVVAHGIRLRLLDWGPRDAPAIVFLHGGALTAHTWDLVCLVTSERYRCIAVDLRGHGDSEWPADGDYSLAATAADITALLAEQVPPPVVLVGMSLGGLVAMRVAGDICDRLAGLVIVDVGPRPNVEGTERIREFMAGDHELDSVEAFVERARAFNPRRRPELLRRSLLHNLRELPDGRWTWKWDRRRLAARGERTERERAELWESVARVGCPALVVRGERSDVFSAANADELVTALPNAELAVVADAGHTVQGDNAGGLLDVLLPFLTRVHPVSAAHT